MAIFQAQLSICLTLTILQKKIKSLHKKFFLSLSKIRRSERIGKKNYDR